MGSFQIFCEPLDVKRVLLEKHGLGDYTVDHAQVLVVIGHSIDRIAGHHIQMSKAQTFVLAYGNQHICG